MLCLFMTRALLQLRDAGDMRYSAVIEDGARGSRYEHARRRAGNGHGAASNRILPMQHARGGAALGPRTCSGGAELCSSDRFRMCRLSCQLAGTHARGQAIQARRIYAYAERKGRSSMVSDAK